MQLSRKLAQYVGIVKFANRTPIIDPRTNQDLDTKLHQYGWLIRAFLLKRRVREDEIWPKIHIMEGVP